MINSFFSYNGLGVDIMSTFLPTILMGLGLSMDAFSLAILYGTLSFNKRQAITLSMIVGAFHFFMPLFGFHFGNFVFQMLSINAHVLIGIIFTIIAIQMFTSLNKEEELITLKNFGSLLLVGFTVSIDSFTVGIGLSAINENIYLAAFIFCLTSALFTLLGLLMGKKLNKVFGQISVLVGSIILFGLGIYYFFF